MKSFKLFVTCAVLTVFAVTSVQAVEDGNPRKGKYLFKKSCKSCHTEAAEGGKITPLSKTMSQWDRFFKKQKHNPAPWKDLSEQDLLDINQFLFDHAVDSDQPETCG